MKCPKCDYLGFETGDRCKNCGYDFSLLSVAEAEPADYEVHPAAVDDVPVHVTDDFDPDDDPWIGADEEPVIRHAAVTSRMHDGRDAAVDDRLAISLIRDAPLPDEPRIEFGPRFTVPTASAEAVPDLPLTPPAAAGPSVDDVDPPTRIAPFLSSMSAPSAPSNDRVLPLFKRPQEHDDEPLIKLPAAPRPPLAVRRTPDTPRLRPGSHPVSRPGPAVLEFSEDVVERPAVPKQEQTAALAKRLSSAIPGEASRPGARVAAALIDYLILVGIHVAVVYFTVRMAGLSMEEWTALPIAPMATFLGLLTVSYFCAFTAVGGQTIGKMALGMCVVDDSGKPVDAARALRRTSAAIVSFLLFGAGFIPALFGDHRALHDRLAGTRVVRLRSV